MPELPWVKWFPSDWASDPNLSMCEPSTRGIWMDAVNAMILTGQPRIQGTVEELSRICRCRNVQFQAALAELKMKKVGNIREHNGNTVIECRRLLRDYNLRELRRKAGIASATKRQHHPQHDVPTNDPTPSAYAYASASDSEGTGEKNGSVDIFKLRGELCSLFRRDSNDRWSYDEEYALSEVAQRTHVVEELEELKRLRLQDGQYFPRSIVALCTKWTQTLDRARNIPPKPYEQKTLLEKQIEQI